MSFSNIEEARTHLAGCSRVVDQLIERLEQEANPVVRDNLIAMAGIVFREETQIRAEVARLESEAKR